MPTARDEPTAAGSSRTSRSARCRRDAIRCSMRRPSGSPTRATRNNDLSWEMDQALASRVFLDRARQFLSVEYRTKIRHAVETLPADLLWARPNESSNSVGNLLMHLSGNVRQWIVSGVGGAPDRRQRATEFE